MVQHATHRRMLHVMGCRTLLQPSQSHLLVAPMMKTVFLLFMPSISVRIWLSTRSAAPPASPTLAPRCVAMLSNSSKNSTHGALCRALSKISRTCAPESNP